MGGVEFVCAFGRFKPGVVCPLVYGVEYAPGRAGPCAYAGDPAAAGGVPEATGLAVYGDVAYGDSGCEEGPSVRTRLLGGSAKLDCDAAGEGECCGGENARGGICACG